MRIFDGPRMARDGPRGLALTCPPSTSVRCVSRSLERRHTVACVGRLNGNVTVTQKLTHGIGAYGESISLSATYQIALWSAAAIASIYQRRGFAARDCPPLDLRVGLERRLPQRLVLGG